jgi:CRP/FNR family transcriptional regulator
MASECDRLSKQPNRSSNNRPSVTRPDRLDGIPLLNILSGADRQRLLHELTEARYGKGEFIFREGDPTEYFHIVKEGTVKCVKSTPDGKECTLKMLMPGDLFCCDAAAFDGSRHPGTAQPMGDVSILRMSKKAYFEMLRRSPDAAIEVIKYLGNRLNEAQEKAKVLALDRADQRLASLLIDLATRSGVKDPQGTRLAIRLTRQDMANMVGTTTETAIRIMSRFKRERLVSGTANRLVIRDLPRLKALAAS